MKQISYERVVEGPDTLRLYLKEISRFPQLTPEEEKDLGARIQKGDEDAFRKLIESNLRFVVAMAKKYSRSGYPLHELINELLLSPMGRRDWPLRFYWPQRLFSVEARRNFVPPDIGALPLRAEPPQVGRGAK